MNASKSNYYQKTIKRLWSYFGAQKLGVIISIFASFLSSGSIVIGAYRLKPIMNQYILTADWTGLFRQLLILGAIYGFGILASIIQTQVMLRVAYQTLAAIRSDLFTKIQRLPIAFSDTRTHGDIMSLFTNDIDALQITLEQSAIMVINSFLQLIGTFTVMLILSPKLLLITLVMSALMIFSSQKLTKISHRYFNLQQDDIAALSGIIEEDISRLETIQVFNYEAPAEKEFLNANKNYQASSTKALFLSGIILPIVNQLNSINLAMTAVVGGILAINGDLNIGALSAYIQMTITYNQPFKMISIQVNNVLAGLAGASRIFAAMEESEEADEGKVIGTDINGNIDFVDVTFSYQEPATVLKNINLSIKSGEKVAFVGSTGAGKTTITNLINRFYNIQNGTILIDNMDITHIKLSDLRKSLGVVLQDTHLFTGTIAENIRYGSINATDQEVIAAAKLSRADYFIKQLPDGYNTMLTNDGENLSSGQRQLIAIARTAIANPNILILDEATSSVDTRTESFVNEGMTALMKDRTVLIIAHRLSTIRNADTIVVLDHGEIIETGNHEELLKKQGHYYNLSMQ